MKTKDIRKTLADHGLYVWQLCDYIGISRQTYYKYSHRGFKGCDDQIKQGIEDLINSQKDNQKGDNSNAD